MAGRRGRPKNNDLSQKKELENIKVPTESQLESKQTVLTQEQAAKPAYIFSDVQDLSELERQEMADYVCDQIRRVLESGTWQKHIEMIDYCWDAYEQKALARTLPYAGAPNVRVDFDATIVEGYISRQLAGNFDVDPYVHMEGANAEDVPRAPKIEKYMQWWHTKKMGIYDIAHMAFLRKAVEGQSVTKEIWERDIERTKNIEDMAVFVKGNRIRYIGRGQMEALKDAMLNDFVPTGEMKAVLIDENRYRHDGPRLINIPGSDYIYPIETTLPDQQPSWEAHQMWMTPDDVIRNIAQKHYYSDVWEKMKKTGTFKKVVAGEKGANEEPEPAQEIETGQFRVMQWFGKYRRKSDPYARTYLLTVHYDTKTLLRPQYHPYNHGDSIFHKNRLFVGRSYWGFGIPWAIRHLAWTSSEMVCQMLESGFLANCLNYKYNKNRFDPEEVAYVPGKGVPLEKMDDLQELNIGGRRQLLDIGLLRTLRDMAESRVGYGRLQSGQPDTRQKTARGVIALLREGAITFDKTIRADQKWLEGITEQEIQLFQQFLSKDGMRFRNLKESVNRLLNDEIAADELFPTMSRGEIAGFYDYIAMGSSHVAIKELDMQLNMMLYDTLKDNIVVKSSPESLYKLTRDLVDSAKKKTEILPPLEEFLARITGGQGTRLTPEQEAEARNYLASQGARPEEVNQVMADLKARAAGGVEGVPSAPPPTEAASPGGAMPASAAEQGG